MAALDTTGRVRHPAGAIATRLGRLAQIWYRDLSLALLGLAIAGP